MEVTARGQQLGALLVLFAVTWLSLHVQFVTTNTSFGTALRNVKKPLLDEIHKHHFMNKVKQFLLPVNTSERTSKPEGERRKPVGGRLEPREPIVSPKIQYYQPYFVTSQSHGE